MIITRTPFRITLGGGGTDLPSYYARHGGFILAAAIDKYMFVNVNRPVVDDLVRVKYSRSETVAHRDELQHEIAREAARDPRSWAAQRRFSATPIDTPLGPRYAAIGVYVLDERAVGAYGRLAPQPLIDDSAQEAVVLLARD